MNIGYVVVEPCFDEVSDISSPKTESSPMTEYAYAVSMTYL